jgi:hypothetical protein
MLHAYALVLFLPAAEALMIPGARHVITTPSWRLQRPSMGLFDGFAKAFANEEFKEDDQRVRASHILIKGDNDVETVADLLQELGTRVQSEPERLGPIFAELARRESQCASASQGGDLGLFGPGKMVQEFDDVLFPVDESSAPPAGAVLGPVVTEFGCHMILVTKRECCWSQIQLGPGFFHPSLEPTLT